MDTVTVSYEEEVKEGERFEFGKNWKNFIEHLDDKRIEEAEKSLTNFVGDITNKKFIDVGSGSGLFSLAARNLGALVFSIDYDPASVYCTQQLKQKFYPSDLDWKIEEASVLDYDYIKSCGQFDVVYSWGVLHHTGKMWDAFANIDTLVDSGGTLFISIYNNQGLLSKYWGFVKKMYNTGAVARWSVLLTYIPYFFLRAIAGGIIKYKNPLGYISKYKKQRGMSIWYDWIDWLGGYPFETATPKQIEDFYLRKGYTLIRLKSTSGIGCNEFVFKKKI